MINPFSNTYTLEISDESLVQQIVDGDGHALEELIRRHQIWIYNIALRMVGHPQDAEDITQEVLIKVLSRLSTFEGKGNFRNWLYRIVANYVINMKKRAFEQHVVSFDTYWKIIENTPDMELPAQDSLPVERSLVLEETKLLCMMGMLLCLNREQRLTFILGELFEVSDTIGSEIFDISKANYRQRLSRARKRVYHFMKEKCGLINKTNPCCCKKKLNALIADGAVDPHNLRFSSGYLYKIKEVVQGKYTKFNDIFDNQCRKLFKDQPLRTPPDFVQVFREMLESDELQDIFDLGIVH